MVTLQLFDSSILPSHADPCHSNAPLCFVTDVPHKLFPGRKNATESIFLPIFFSLDVHPSNLLQLTHREICHIWLHCCCSQPPSSTSLGPLELSQDNKLPPPPHPPSPPPPPSDSPSPPPKKNHLFRASCGWRVNTYICRMAECIQEIDVFVFFFGFKFDRHNPISVQLSQCKLRIQATVRQLRQVLLNHFSI